MAPPQKRRLGRGLSSLLSSSLPVDAESGQDPTSPATVSPPRFSPSDGPAGPHGRVATLGSNEALAGDQIVRIPLERIRPNPHQPRRGFDQGQITELAASIESNGLIQPIVVRAAGRDFELITGERRLRAVTQLGHRDIQAIIRQAEETQMLEWALIENIHRTDLNPIERARAYHRFLKQFDLTHEQVGQRVGEDRATVTNYIRIMDLPDVIQGMIEAGKLGVSHAKSLLALPNATEQIRMAERAVQQNWALRRLDDQIKRVLSPAPPAEKPATASGNLVDMETQFRQTLGLKVLIQPGRKKHVGKVVIEYHSLDDFDTIRQYLGPVGQQL